MNLINASRNSLNKKGSQLINHVRIEKVQGDSQIVPQLDWSDTEEVKIQNENRLLEPKLIKEIKITLSDVEVTRQGEPTADELAEKLAMSAATVIDKIIINGIGGMAKTQSSGDIALPLSQYISVDTIQLGNNGNTLLRQGLTSSKIISAVEALNKKLYNPALICVCSNRAMEQLKINKETWKVFHPITKVFNIQFVVSELVPKKIKAHLHTGGDLITLDSKTAKESDAGEVELAYMYAKDQIVLGSNMEFELKFGKDSNSDWVFQYLGQYDAVRMREDAVVAIEVNIGNKIITE